MSLSVFLRCNAWRALIFGWRNVCRVVTRLRHPLLAGKPALLLRYETPAQKAAYIGTNLAPTLDLTRTSRVLVIVPFRDKWVLTQQALESLLRQQLDAIEVLVALVDNGSVEPDTRAGIAHSHQRKTSNLRFRHLRYAIPFNYSRLNNLAVADCADFEPDHILFLNNDVELIDPATVAKLSAFMSANPACGSVGCSLVFPDRKVQHLFIFPGCKIGGAHPFRGLPLQPDDPWMQSPRPVGGCTAAMLLVRHADFLSVGGFEEQLARSVQDIDLALKLQQLGRINWVLPDLVAIHRESQSREATIHWNEVAWLINRWGHHLFENAYASPRFCRWSERLVLTLGEGRYPWRAVMPPKP